MYSRSQTEDCAGPIILLIAVVCAILISLPAGGTARAILAALGGTVQQLVLH